MIEWFKKVFEKFEDEGLARRMLMLFLGIFFGVLFVVVAPAFNTLAVTVIFYCFGCILFLAFGIAAWVDYYEDHY